MLNTDNDFEKLAQFTADPSLVNALSLSTDDYIYMCDMSKNLFYFPLEMVEDFDLPSQIIEDAATLWGSKIHIDERQSFFDAFADIINGKTNEHNQEYRALDKNGHWVWLRCRGYLDHDKNGNPTIFAGIITNLGKKSKIDPMSGLLNKFEFEGNLRTILQKRPSSLSLLVLGLDNLKHVNNLYGWAFGDEVIHLVAQKMQSVLPIGTALYRLDGDTFAIISNAASNNEIERLYHKISREFQSQQEYKGNKFYCTISGGYVTLMGEDLDFDTFFRRAQYALEHAKSQGKNRLCVFSVESMNTKDRKVAISEYLRESVDANFANFELYYQPQVEAMSMQVVSAEALLRWSCTKFGMVSPVEFIPLLEQSGLIRSVGRWVIDNAACTCAKWRKQNPDFIISVNISYIQILEENFTSFLASVLEKYDLPVHSLHLELTESCIASGSQTISDAFLRLREMGFFIEMDDFGTGYSSLDLLKNEPADVVKIDRAFVKDIVCSEFDSTFIRFIVALCHSVNIIVCLEGVETWEEYNIVRTMDLDLIQGYLFGHPIPAKDFEIKHLN